MKVISRGEFENDPDAVTADVEAGETYLITRDGVAFAEFRPAPRRRLTAAELVARDRTSPTVDGPALRAEGDEFFGAEDRVGDDLAG